MKIKKSNLLDLVDEEVISFYLNKNMPSLILSCPPSLKENGFYKRGMIVKPYQSKSFCLATDADLLNNKMHLFILIEPYHSSWKVIPYNPKDKFK